MYVDPTIIDSMVRRHFLRIRDTPKYARCHVKVYIEANLSFVEARRVHDLIRFDPRMGDIDVVRFDPDCKDRVGVWTTKDRKEAYVINIRTHIHQMRRAAPFLSLDAAGCWKLLCDQLRVFRKEVDAPASGSTTALTYKVGYTGKSPGRKDDLVMALGIVLYHMIRTVNVDEEFIQMCAMRGLAVG